MRRLGAGARRREDWIGAASAAGLTLGAAVIGGFAGDFRSPWYRGIRKPSWQPSGQTIGAVWSVLYAMIALSGGLLWLRRSRGIGTVAALFVAQAVLNAAWTPLFTRARMLRVATAECAALTAVNVALVAASWRVRRPAAALLVPYACWTGFATFLTWTLYRLNR